MRKLLLLLSLLLFISLTSCSKAEEEFQDDADLIRLEHLVYWTGLVEEYQQKTGFYPFQTQLNSKEDIGLVKIATTQQLQYLSPGNQNYNPDLDNNNNNYFNEFEIKKLVSELERVLEKEIEEKYDIQKVPTKSTIGYYYFVSTDGYLIWATCISCGVTEISTLLMDGFTPTVNIVSEGMEGKVTKALTRTKMLSHPQFKDWVSNPLQKEEYVRNIVKENSRDSKK
jgi:hypothetical protein